MVSGGSKQILQGPAKPAPARPGIKGRSNPFPGRTQAKGDIMDDLRHLLPLLIPIVAIVGGLSIPLVFLVVQSRRRQQLLEQNHRERMAALERGIELPPIPIELLVDWPHNAARGQRGRTCDGPDRHLRTGVFWLFVGAALGVALWVSRGAEQAVWALIPIAAGLAKLVLYAMTPKQADLPLPGQPPV
jgi:hypothetical protein